jgi:chromosomal replication initiation ATPase DnaA
MFEYYSKYVLKTATPDQFQHQYMADKYRGVIKEALKEYDGNQHSEDFYDALSWNGLKKTVSWNKLSEIERTKILQTIQINYRDEIYCN